MKKHLGILTVMVLIVSVFVAVPALRAAEDVEGCWESVNEQGKVTAKWNFEVVNDKLRGKITNVPGQADSTLCDKCTEENGGAEVAKYFNKPIVGTYWAWGMKKDGDTWKGGRILDSGAGKLYYVKVWIEDGKLKLKGSLDKSGFVGKSQTWRRCQ